MSNARVWGALVLIFGAAAARLLPHPANVTPIIAMALFAGATLTRKPLALLLPLAAMLLSDLVLGFHQQMGAVYGSIVLVALIGLLVQKNRKVPVLAGASVASSLLFFAITNFTVWFQSGMYPRTGAGLVQCYIAALPFLRNGVLGDLAFTAVLFGAYALMTRSVLRPSAVRA
ncbi:MAG: hypothetical protein EOP05_22715 [Proteobacteria bacterium]|nr:MAG: hypothetical protein EOP05_22715 [Pseudomonadota bacterium]